jgi:hypothetical protein
VQTKSKTARTKFARALVAGVDKDELRHVTMAMESICEMSQWHTAQISYRSNCKCHAQQAGTKQGVLLGLPRALEALLLQYIGVGKLNMVATNKLLRTSGFALITSSTM